MGAFNFINSTSSNQLVRFKLIHDYNIVAKYSRGIEWSLRACEQCVYFCEREQ